MLDFERDIRNADHCALIIDIHGYSCARRSSLVRRDLNDSNGFFSMRCESLRALWPFHPESIFESSNNRRARSRGSMIALRDKLPLAIKRVVGFLYRQLTRLLSVPNFFVNNESARGITLASILFRVSEFDLECHAHAD